MSHKIYPKTIGMCLFCKGSIVAKYAAMNKPNRKFCSYKCRTIWRNKNIPQTLKQRKLSAERSRKLFTGVKKSEVTRLKMSEIHLGNKSLFWKGGLTDKNRKLRNGVLNKIWKEKVLKRDNYTCQKCGAKKSDGIRIETDHIKSWAEYPKLRFDINNGRTLCNSCHKKTDNFGSKNISK